MQVVLAGPLASTLEQVEAWRRRAEPGGLDAIREAMMAWGFVMEPDQGEVLDPLSIAYPTEEFGEQGVYLCAPEISGFSFFIHGYRMGTPLLVDDLPIEVPEPSPLPDSLLDRYIPPAMSEFPSHFLPPPKHPVYRCPKCGCNEPVFSQLRGSGGGVEAYFDIDNEIFTVVTCTFCSYSEFYRDSIAQVKSRLTPT